MIKNLDSAVDIHPIRECRQYRFPPTSALKSRKEEQAYRKAEVIMGEFVDVMLYFNARVEGPGATLRSSFAPLPDRVYYHLRDTVVDILLDKCRMVLVDGEWIRVKTEDEYENAFGPRPRVRVKRRPRFGARLWRKLFMSYRAVE